MLPERDSSRESTKLGRGAGEKLGITYQTQDIAPMLEAAGCYAERDAAVRSVFPAFEPGMRWKITMHGDRLGSEQLNVFYVVVRDAQGEEHKVRLTAEAYLQSWRQRTSSSARARCSSTTRRIGCTTRLRARRIGSSTTRASS